jgi:hypothetical protein
MNPIPTIGRIVHYVGHGTPGGEYGRECRAAIVTEVDDQKPVPEHGVPYVGLAVLNPGGIFFKQHARYDEGRGAPGDPACPAREKHRDPMRYCACGWMEPSYAGGTWHWPERAS